MHAGLEDDFAIEDDGFIVEDEFDGAAEHFALQALAPGADVFGAIDADIDLEDVLEDDRPGIEVRGDEVGGAAGDADAVLPGAAVGVGAGKVGQERGVDVDDAPVIGRDDGRGEDAHVAGEDDEVRLVVC